MIMPRWHWRGWFTNSVYQFVKNLYLYNMIRTIITPTSASLQLKLPEEYVGKEIEVIVFALDEITDVSQMGYPIPGVMAKFWGVISQETGEEMQ